MAIGYLFSDIERSTERWERVPERMRDAVKRQNALIEDLVCKYGGHIHDRAGDGVFAIFASGNPLRCALEIQLAMQREDWSAVGGLELRLGVHVSQTAEDATTLDQASVNRAARIVASGWGGQIVASGEAIAAYEAPDGASFVDLGVCHFQGIEEPLRLSGLIHPILEKTEFPPLRSHLIQAAGVPRPPGPFIGRERERAEILARLQDAKLVTIVGPGGTGKTRLAAELASELALARPVAFVSLDAVETGAGLVSAVAATLRFPFHGPEDREIQLLGYLRDRPTLLVLDNADAIAGEASFVDELIGACPRLTILATSREPLRNAGEVLYRLAGLSFKDDTGVLNTPAHQLFAFEAGAQGVGYKYGNEQAATFLKICSLVDGSPLALRLVARWSRVLSLEDMLEQLKNDSSFLSSDVESGGALSIKRVFEGSWRLLNANQRTALARLSVFSGPFDWNAAKHVANVDLATYGALADKSLLDEDALRRFSIHPLIRMCAREKLAFDPNDQAITLGRHADYYLDLVRAKGGESDPVLLDAAHDQLQLDFSDIRAAWIHANATGSERVRKTLLPLHHFLNMRSMIREGIALFSVQTSDAQTRQLLQAALSNCLFQQSDFKAAEAAALGVFQMRGDTVGRAYARNVLGNIAHAQGNYLLARRHYERALGLWSRAGCDLQGSYTATSLALLRFAHGDRSEAANWIKQAFRLSRQAGNTQCMLLTQMLAGDLALWQRRPGAAKINYEKALRLEATGRMPHVRGSVLRRLGSLSRQMGDAATAWRQHKEALDLASEVGEQRARAHALVEIGEDLASLGQPDEARSNLMQGLGLASTLSMQPLVSQGLIALAKLEFQFGAKRHAARIANFLAGSALGELEDAYEAMVRDCGMPIAAPERLTLKEILDDIADEAEIGAFD